MAPKAMDSYHDARNNSASPVHSTEGCPLLSVKSVVEQHSPRLRGLNILPDVAAASAAGLALKEFDGQRYVKVVRPSGDLAALVGDKGFHDMTGTPAISPASVRV